MTRRGLIVGFVTLAVLAVAGWVVWLRMTATPSGIFVSGDVRVIEQIVVAPAIVQPTPDVAVGISSTTGGAPSSRGADGPTMPTASRAPVVSGFLNEVLVSQGERVTAGQVVAKLDTTALDLGVAQAAAAAHKSRTDVAVLDSNVDKFETARSKLVTAEAKLRRTRTALQGKLPALLRQRASLEASITALQRIISQPGGPPPVNPPLPVILAKMKAGLAGLNKGIAGIRSGLAQMSAALAKMQTGLAQIDSARDRLRDLRGILLAQIQARDTAVRSYCGDVLGRCPFSAKHSPQEGIPVVVVDEEIYRLPALLIATVDKFAQMPWNGAVQMLFGQVDGHCERARLPLAGDRGLRLASAGASTCPPRRTVPHRLLRPPDLIIQDELHLISGPLGTLVGLYETAVDELCSGRSTARRCGPRSIASTATIRRAGDQVHAPSCANVNSLPAARPDVGDNFFALRQPTRRGMPRAAVPRHLRARAAGSRSP